MEHPMPGIDERWLAMKRAAIDALYREANGDPALIVRLIPHLEELRSVLPQERVQDRLYVAGLLGSALVGAAMAGESQKARQAVSVLCEALDIASTYGLHTHLEAAARQVARAMRLDTSWLDPYRQRDVEALLALVPTVQLLQNELTWRTAAIGSRPMTDAERKQIRDLERSILDMKTIERRSSTHDSAVQVISDAFGSGKPLALYLRSFSRESEHSLRLRGPEGAVAAIRMRHDHVPRALVGLLGSHLPVVGIRNMSDGFSQRERVPMLEIPAKNWQDVAFRLVSFCNIIVLAVDSPTVGITAEIDMIRAVSRQESTVVVLPRSRSPDVLQDAWFGEDVSQKVSDLTGEGWVKALPDFSRLVWEDNLVPDSKEWLACIEKLFTL